MEEEEPPVSKNRESLIREEGALGPGPRHAHPTLLGLLRRKNLLQGGIEVQGPPGELGGTLGSRMERDFCEGCALGEESFLS